MIENGLRNVMEVIMRQKWEKLFKRRELVHVDAVKEFYAKLTMSHNRKKDVAKSKVRGVEIVFDHMKLTSILGIPGNNRILEMKPFQRFIHFLVMKNVVPRFGKRDTTSYMDLIYMDHLIARRLVNFPRVMMRHMSYVISVKDHELPYGDWLTMVFEEFGVPLVDKKGEEPKILSSKSLPSHGEEKCPQERLVNFFEDTFLTMCKLIRENGVWWISTGENRRRDDEIEAPAEEVNEEEVQNDFDWEAVIDEAADQGESVSGEKFYDAEDEIQEPATVVEEVSAVAAQDSAQQKETEAAGVDPSGLSGHIPDPVMRKLQADFEKARVDKIQANLERAQAENARLLALLQQAQSKRKPKEFHC
ncbi:hypothetical protein Dimus_016017 [Dionaea muscipula]